MKRLTTLDLNKLTPHVVGFDRLFDEMDRMFANSNQTNGGYPPYNIRKNDNLFQIEIALAGVTREDITITTENGELIISYNPEDIESETTEWIHKGIAQRKFTRVWKLADDVVVKGATMENGMLYIELERIIPEEKKSRQIDIK
jgi:molecular chaperone IbpA